ncbi:hypothetical protein BDDG_03927 [Blastomyces dermatitidis ATCC 18188]|uniref:Uncharacterized protein n=1 Tax=Ajellomyces dermatitidis (strain ATCC 18188 / CBS 674.68) TaxID=653446 RepID=F2TCM3_AJEDA|nr:hypothetical protein BDDG_03927 [Blastomyces dermatitidis ATCC 18188]
MPPTEPDDDYDPYRYPIFYLPDITLADDPIHLPAPLIPEFRHKDQEYKLLSHLWHVQLGHDQARHHWNIQALHGFWRTYGPRTFEGRYYGWSPTWIVDALFSLQRDLEKLQKVADRIMLKRARMRAQARKILKRAGVQVEDESWVNDEEVELAVELAREDVGDEGCAGDEEVMIKKIRRDREREREKEREKGPGKERRRLGARAGGRRRSRSSARLGSSDSEATNESPTHKPPPARKRPTTPPDSSAIDASESARKADTVADRQREQGPRGDREQKSVPQDFLSRLTCFRLGNSLSKEEMTGTPPPMDMEIQVSEYEVSSGLDSEPEQLREHMLHDGDGAGLACPNNDEFMYPGEGSFRLTSPTPESKE